MMVDYRGLSHRYNPQTKMYSRPPVDVYRICKHGFKRQLRKDDDGCPCYKCSKQRSTEYATKDVCTKCGATVIPRFPSDAFRCCDQWMVRQE